MYNSLLSQSLLHFLGVASSRKASFKDSLERIIRNGQTLSELKPASRLLSHDITVDVYDCFQISDQRL